MMVMYIYIYDVYLCEKDLRIRWVNNRTLIMGTTATTYVVENPTVDSPSGSRSCLSRYVTHRMY